MTIRADLMELEDMAVDAIEADLDEVMDAVIDEDGLTYGDVEFESEEDFMLAYQDMDDRGVLEFLDVVSPKLAARWQRRYDRAALKVLA